MSKKNLSLELSSQPIFYVYALIDPFTRKPFYIGKGHGGRIYSHVRYVKRCLNNIIKIKNSKKFQKIKKILSLGGKVIHKKLKENLIESEAFRLEEKYIRYFGLENLTNLTYGGEGEIPGEETRKKMSLSRKGKTLGEDNPFYGRKHSEEAKMKISKFHKGNKYTLGSKRTKEQRERISKAMIGRKLKEEHKNNISKGLLKLKDRPNSKKVFLMKNGITIKMFYSIRDFTKFYLSYFNDEKYKDGKNIKFERFRNDLHENRIFFKSNLRILIN